MGVDGDGGRYSGVVGMGSVTEEWWRGRGESREVAWGRWWGMGEGEEVKNRREEGRIGGEGVSKEGGREGEEAREEGGWGRREREEG